MTWAQVMEWWVLVSIGIGAIMVACSFIMFLVSQKMKGKIK